MDAEAWTIVCVIAGNVIALGALIVSGLSWRVSHRAAKANEGMAATNRRMAESAVESGRSAIELLASETVARQDARKARFKLSSNRIRSDSVGRVEFRFAVSNIGQFTADKLQLRASGPGIERESLDYGGAVEAGASALFTVVCTPMYGAGSIDVYLTYRDGTGERRQSFRVLFIPSDAEGYRVEGITETAPDPVPLA